MHRKNIVKYELPAHELKLTCHLEEFDFEDTSKILPLQGIVGQERALKALKLGIELESKGYNIFVTGLSGTGKATTIKTLLDAIKPKAGSLLDYVYVNNFDDLDRPLLLTFPAGKGVKFKEEFEKSIDFIVSQIPVVLNSEAVTKKREKLLNNHNRQQEKLKEDLQKNLLSNNFQLGRVTMGEISRPEIMPVINNEPVMLQQLSELVQKNKISKGEVKKIEKKYLEMQEKLEFVFKKSFELTREYQNELSTLEQKAAQDLLSVTFDRLAEKFDSEKVIAFIEKTGTTILSNLNLFKPQSGGTEKGANESPDLQIFKVNLFLDNSNNKDRPIIIETSPNFSNLFGSIDKYSDGKGGWYADFTQIKSGSILRANGGYLVLNAKDAFSEPGVWKTLQRVMLHGVLEIQDFPGTFQSGQITLKPEPIEINTKIIMIGSNKIYSLLSEYEDDFNKLFKVKADFDYEIKRSEKSIMEYAGIIKKLIKSEKLMEFDRSAIARIIDYGARFAGDQNKLTTRFAHIADLVRESNFWATDDGVSIVSGFHVDKAQKAATERHALYDDKIKEMISEGTMLIATDGIRVGQINGLAVYESGAFSFGKPARITASVGIGQGDIVNVEREAGLSGQSHDKAVMIISGYFREKFGRNIPLSINANLVFEQGYGMIDGDSASITEICALLSAISGIGIRQSLAITGSVNQKGDIQPIGGVNEKIEGFFEICRQKGLNGEQGVIIPELNRRNLMLSDNVIEAVAEKKFHIYAISSVDQAVELLMGKEAGIPGNSGKYPEGSVYYCVEKELKRMYENSGTKNITKPKSRKTK